MDGGTWLLDRTEIWGKEGEGGRERKGALFVERRGDSLPDFVGHLCIKELFCAAGVFPRRPPIWPRAY